MYPLNLNKSSHFWAKLNRQNYLFFLFLNAFTRVLKKQILFAQMIFFYIIGKRVVFKSSLDGQNILFFQKF
jgi:hypothetical protein